MKLTARSTSRMYALTCLACVIWLWQSLVEANNDGSLFNWATIVFSLCLLVVIGWSGWNAVAGWNAKETEAGHALGVEYVSLDELFARSDVLGLQMPLFPFNTGIINKENIAKMKDGVIIINNSRGQMVVEQDLADALNSGKVAAAGLDVVSTEPIRGDNPLLKAKNCIITPHMSWGAKESRQRIMDCTVENVKAYLAGAPVNVVN